MLRVLSAKVLVGSTGLSGVVLGVGWDTADSGGSDAARACSDTGAMPVAKPLWNAGTSDLGVSHGSSCTETSAISGCSGTSDRSQEDSGDGALYE